MPKHTLYLLLPGGSHIRLGGRRECCFRTDVMKVMYSTLTDPAL